MLAAAPAMGLGGVAAAAEADGMKPRFEATANVAFVSDYLARGITVSDRDPTVQGGFDFSAAGGWSAGVWASGIDGGPGATLEMDIVAGKTFAIGEGELAVGGTWYHYPGGHDLDYGEVTASWAQPIGEVDTTFGVAYAWEQEATADADNTYVYQHRCAAGRGGDAAAHPRGEPRVRGRPARRGGGQGGLVAVAVGGCGGIHHVGVLRGHRPSR